MDAVYDLAFQAGTKYASRKPHEKLSDLITYRKQADNYKPPTF